MERSKDWMAQAKWDLRHAQNDLQNGFYDWACFSAQQAAEKATKAVLMKLGGEPWGHSVADLLQEIKRFHQVPSEWIEGGYALDKAYIPARYPNAHPAGAPYERFTHQEAQQLIRYAQQIVQFCEGLLSEVDHR